jgi:hydroxyproline transporter system substrate-binding protein
MKSTIFTFTACCCALIAAILPAHADKLDDIISSGKLRCAVTLDIPPNGFRDDKSEPAGFDVDYCHDLAKVLGVEPEIVETQLPDRIPAIMSNRADIAVASTSDTLERAKTIGFSIPYFAYKQVVLTRKDTGITSYEDIKGHKTGAVAGTFEGLQWEADVKKLADPNTTFRAYQSQADVILALSQGQIDATPVISTMTNELIKSGKYPDLIVAGDTPYVPDYVALVTLRGEQGLINYMDLFINQQVRTGRYAELYKKWIGQGDVVDLTVKGVYR